MHELSLFIIVYNEGDLLNSIILTACRLQIRDQVLEDLSTRDWVADRSNNPMRRAKIVRRTPFVEVDEQRVWLTKILTERGKKT